MEKRLFLCLVWLSATSAFANNEPVPPDTFMSNLPADTRILVKKNIPVGQKFSTYSGMENSTRTLIIDEVLVPTTILISTSALSIFHEPEQKNWISVSSIDGPLPQTVAEFEKRTNYYFQLIYDDPAQYDPYPGMEKDVVVDLVMAKITTALKDKKFKQSLKDFAFLEKQNSALPESFYFYYADTLEKSGKKDEARLHASSYLKKYGKKGKYYAQVVELMSRL